MVLAAVVQGLIALAELGYIGIIDQLRAGEATTSEVEDVRAGVGAVYVLALLVGLPLAGFYIAWFHRAYANLGRLSVAELRYGRGWAIGAWFIPFFNWIRPKQIANDIWRAGESGVEVRDGSWRRRPVSPLLHWWWGVYLASLIVGVAGSLLGGTTGEVVAGREEMETEQTAAAIAAFAALLSVVAAILAVKVVRRLTARGDSLRAGVLAAGTDRAERTSGEPPPLPSASPAPSGPGARARCQVCGWVFGDGDALRRHVATHHPRAGRADAAPAEP